MIKNFSKFSVLLLATFLLANGKTVAKEVPLGPVGFDEEQKHWTWSPLSYVDGLICKKEDLKYPVSSSSDERNFCGYENWYGRNFSLFNEKLKQRDISSIN
jgi:hypothetical protein